MMHLFFYPIFVYPPMVEVKIFTRDFLVSAILVLQVFLTAIVFIVGDDWKGDKSGAGLNPKTRKIAFSVSVLLVFAVAANLSVIIFKLLCFPENLNILDEISITAAALSVLWWTDVLRIRKRVRRRRKLADLMAMFPTFRFGTGSRGSPIPLRFINSEFVIRSANYKIFRDSNKSEKECSKYWCGLVTKVFISEHSRNGNGVH